MSHEYTSLLDMSNKEAKKFFLKPESYFNSKLPEYLDFSGMLNSADKLLTTKKGNPQVLDNVVKSGIKYSERSNLNYEIVMNKSGDYSWRPLVLIHPVLYVDLVNILTEKNNWDKLLERFKEFQMNDKISCYSIPLQAEFKPGKKKQKTDLGVTILNWWKKFEQASIEKNIKYKYAMFTDIANCYPSIYTHSIAWAIHGKQKIKGDKSYGVEWLGGKIDQKIAGMQYNQTNGIPQGSVLMDFIAEIVLGYADLKLSENLKKLEEKDIIGDYKILRYRDDYRIFANDIDQLEIITRRLADTLFELNLQLNTKKTKLVKDLVLESIKPDKLYWNQIDASLKYRIIGKDNKKKTQYSLNLQKHLIEIKILSSKYPNSGMIKNALSNYYKNRIKPLNRSPDDTFAIIGILVNIMIESPDSVAHCIIIIAELLKKYDDSSVALKTIESILQQYSRRSNTEYLILWIQRLLMLFEDLPLEKFETSLTAKVRNPEEVEMFSKDWLSLRYQNQFQEDNLVNEEKLEEMKHQIYLSEINDLNYYDI
ncbi:RNA-directed DNA polymerase [Dolosicoccus paucivorans]|nr:RNA-directed DNA polymerase [Dolosicoccus paucivorans]